MKVLSRSLIFERRVDYQGAVVQAKRMVTWIISVAVEVERSRNWRKSWENLLMDWI